MSEANSSQDDSEKQELLSRFRTITSLINLLQHPSLHPRPKNTSVHDAKLDKKTRQWVEGLSALATILARESEAVAVISKGLHVQADGVSSLEVIACRDPHSNDHPDASVSQSSSPFSEHVIAEDYRIPSICSKNDYDSINTPRVLAPEGSVIEAACPFSYIFAHWPPSFQDHAAAIVAFLSPWKDPSAPPSQLSLLRYMIATSFPKMNSRISHRHSEPMFDRLTSLPSLLDWSLPLHQFARDKKHDHDHEFLRLLKFPFFPRMLSADALPVLNLPALDIPKLSALANLPKSDPVFDSLYPNDVYHEFQKLLQRVLIGYKHSLNMLDGFKPESDKPTFILVVDRIMTYGLTLRAIAYSRLFYFHLQNMDVCLLSTSLTMNTTCVGDGDEDEDLELTFVHHASWELPEHKLYRNWLRLQISHFEAATLLHKIVGQIGKRADISIKVITLAPQETTMQTWRQVIEDIMRPVHSDVSVSFNASASSIDLTITDTDITNSIDSTPFTAAGVIKMLLTWKEENHWLKSNLDDQSPLSTGTGYRGTVHSEAFLASLQYLAPKGAPTSSTDQILDISYQLADASESFIGVSRRCCAVCSVLTEVLGLGGQSVLVGDSCGGTVYPCSLPPWLPVFVIREMVDRFRDELVGVLRALHEQFIACQELRWQRGSSGAELTSDVRCTGDDGEADSQGVLEDFGWILGT